MPHHLRQGSPCALPPAAARSTEPHPESARLRRLARSVPVPRLTWPCRRSQTFSSGHQLPFTENRCSHCGTLDLLGNGTYGTVRSLRSAERDASLQGVEFVSEEMDAYVGVAASSPRHLAQAKRDPEGEMKSTAVPLPVCSLLAALVLFSIVGGVPSLLAQTSDFDHKEVAENLAMKLMIEIPDGSEVALRPFHLVDGNILPDEIGEQIYNLLTLELNEAKKTVKVLTRRLIEVYETFQDHAQEKSIEELLRAMQGDIEILCQVRRVKGGLNLSCEAPNLDTGENIGNGGVGISGWGDVKCSISSYSNLPKRL